MMTTRTAMGAGELVELLATRTDQEYAPRTRTAYRRAAEVLATARARGTARVNDTFSITHTFATGYVVVTTLNPDQEQAVHEALGDEDDDSPDCGTADWPGWPLTMIDQAIRRSQEES